MRPAVLQIVLIGSIVAMSVTLAAVASTFALARAQVQLLDGDMASVIRADYSADPEGTSLGPFEEGITDAVRRDEARLRKDFPEVEIVPVSYTSSAQESTPEAVPGGTPSASPTPTQVGTPSASPTPMQVGTPSASPTPMQAGTPTPTPEAEPGVPGETPPPAPAVTPPPPPAAPPSPAPTPTPTPTSTTASFGPVADTYVDQNRTKTNFGTDTKMEVRTWAPEKNERAYMQFDVSSIPAGSTVSLATLTLCATSVPSVTRTYNVYQVTAHWDEAGLAWITQANAGTVTASTTTPTSPGCMTWVVTVDVQAWVDGSPNKGWDVRDAVEDFSATKYFTVFRTREDSVAAELPTLDVTYTTS